MFTVIDMFDSGECDEAPPLPIVSQEPKDNYSTTKIELNFIDAQGKVLITLRAKSRSSY